VLSAAQVSGAQSTEARRSPPGHARSIEPQVNRQMASSAMLDVEEGQRRLTLTARGRLQRAEQGLREANSRLRSRMTGADSGDPLIALVEALNWAYAIEEWHRKRMDKKQKDSYYSARDKDPDGQIVAGVMYARNLVVHQLANVSILVGVYTHTYTATYKGQWRWRLYHRLPKPDKPEKWGRDKQYRNRVAKQPVLTTMDSAERFLLDKAKRL
jgi:hypothetical protein